MVLFRWGGGTLFLFFWVLLFFAFGFGRCFCCYYYGLMCATACDTFISLGLPAVGKGGKGSSSHCRVARDNVHDCCGVGVVIALFTTAVGGSATW